MTTAGPTTPRAPADPSPSAAGPPWLLRFLCFLIPALPTAVVLPGALGGNGSPARMLGLASFGLVVLGFLVVRRTAHARRVNPGAIILLLYFLLWLTTYGVGLLHYDNYVISTNRTRQLVGLIAHVGAALYVLARVHTARQRDIVLGWLAAGLTFACFVGLLQGVSSIDLRFLLEPPGFVLNSEVAALGLSERLGVARVQGTSQHAIEFSVLAAVTVLLMLYFARNAATRQFRLLSGAACGVALLALPASGSRSGIVSLIAALLVYMFAFKVRTIAIAFVAGSIAVGGYIVASPQVANALWTTITGSAEDDSSIESRILAYQRVSDVLHEHPLFGLGLGGAPSSVIGFLDDEWMQAIVQGGLVGLTAMTVLGGGVIFGLAAALRRAGSPGEREQAYMLGAMATGILASSFTFDLFTFEQAAVLFFLLIALLWSGFTIAMPEPNEHLTDRISSGADPGFLVKLPRWGSSGKVDAVSVLPG